MRAVLVGCGAMSKAWLEALRRVEDVSIAGLVDLETGRAEARAKEFDLEGVAIGADFDAVLQQTKPDIVFEAALPQSRRSLALLAFSHGCHLLTEKPLADSRENAAAIIAAAKSTGRHHAVMQNRRYVA